MKRYSRLLLTPVVWTMLATVAGHGQDNQVSTVGTPVSAEVGHPKIYRYNRIAQLWEGIGLDGYAITVSQLNLSPTAQNAAQTDAIQSSLQGSVQFNPVQGALNALNLQSAQAANQQNLALANSAGAQNVQAAQAAQNFQTQIMSQIGPMLTALQNAQQIQAQTQAVVSAMDPKDAISTNPAVIALNQATANVTSLTNDISTAKGLITASPSVTAGSAVTPTSPTVTGVTPSATTFPTPTTMLMPATVTAPSMTNGPTLPSSRQLDAQFDTLWDRLTRVATMLSQPDSLNPNDELFLIEFDASVLAAPGKRLLHTGYTVSCAAATGQIPGTVLDVYPRVAAVNIGESKYRDSKVSLSFLASLFSTGVSAAYNREHLKMSQALSPSSYVTGYGVGTADFGWYFGAVLGEDKVAPGIRKTYALVALDGDCLKQKNQVLLIAQRALGWTKGIQDTPQQFNTASWTLEAKDDSMQLTKMEYTPVAYTLPWAAPPAAATLLLTFDKRVDQALTISANGVNLYRVRDNFARATPPTTLTNYGLLETQTAGAGTWTLVGDHQLLVRLDPTQYSQGFPDLLFTTPRGETYLSGFLKKNKLPEKTPDGKTTAPEPLTALTLYGHPFFCGTQESSSVTNCSITQLPPLGVVTVAAPRKIYAARYRELAHGNRPENDQVILTVGSAPAAATPAAGTSTQVIQQGVGHLWSTASYAMLYDRDNYKWFSLSCNQGAFRLTCTMPNAVDPFRRFNIFTADSLYDSGPVAGPVELVRCNSSSWDPCQKPSVWRIDAPAEMVNPNGPATGWKMPVVLQGACPDSETCTGTTVTLLNPANGAFLPLPAIYTSGTIKGDLRDFSFDIPASSYPALSEVMTIKVSVPIEGDRSGTRDAYIRVGPVLSAVSPIVRSVTQNNDAKITEITGVNLIFNGIKVAPNGAIQHANCSSSSGSDWCSYPQDLGKTSGPVYFTQTSNSATVVARPLRQLASDGVTLGTALTYIYTPPPKDAPPKTPGTGTTTITITTGSANTAAATADNATSAAPVNAQAMPVTAAVTASFFSGGATGNLQTTDQTSALSSHSSASPNPNPTQMYIVPQ
jgi:hypothetical protein